MNGAVRRKNQTIRMSDAERRQVDRTAKQAGYDGFSEYCREVLLGQIPSSWCDNKKNLTELLEKIGGETAKNSPSDVERMLLACAFETNMLLRSYVMEYLDEGEETAEKTRNALPGLLEKYGIPPPESPDEDNS